MWLSYGHFMFVFRKYAATCDLAKSRHENFYWWRSWLADIAASCDFALFLTCFPGRRLLSLKYIQDTCCFVPWRQLSSFSLQTPVAPCFTSRRKLFPVAFSWVSPGLATSWFCWEPFQSPAPVHTRPLGPGQLPTFQMTDWPGWEIMTISGRSYIFMIYPIWNIIPTCPAQTSAPHSLCYTWPCHWMPLTAVPAISRSMTLQELYSKKNVLTFEAHLGPTSQHYVGLCVSWVMC